MRDIRLTRCEACRKADRRYCEHNGVLVMYIDDAPVFIASFSESQARRTADKVRIAMKGRPFNPLNI